MSSTENFYYIRNGRLGFFPNDEKLQKYRPILKAVINGLLTDLLPDSVSAFHVDFTDNFMDTTVKLYGKKEFSFQMAQGSKKDILPPFSEQPNKAKGGTFTHYEQIISELGSADDSGVTSYYSKKEKKDKYSAYTTVGLSPRFVRYIMNEGLKQCENIEKNEDASSAESGFYRK